MAAPKVISQEELIAKIRDLDTSDDEIAQYFIVDKNSDAFSPRVVPNPKLIEDNGMEGAFALNAFNKLARGRRNRKYHRRLRNWDGVRIVAEGDSWFQYPLILKDTIDQLIDTDNFQYAIYGLSEAGDLLSNIIGEDEISEAMERENPDVFLISGGGNDMVGDGRAATLVHKFSANRKPENYPNQNFDTFLEELERLYRGLFSRLLADRPHLKIICHGYDNVIPQDGPWLGKPLCKQNITNKTLQRKIFAEMIHRFNGVMSKLSAAFPKSVYHVDLQNTVGTVSKWHDELHPKNEGYLKVAQKFDQAIKLALSESAPSPAIELSAIKGLASEKETGPSVKLAQVQKLDNQDFLNLVVKRAELNMGKEIEPPKTRFERKQIEKDISEFFEKIHKEANFLPSSFLENGVGRAQAVCRIVTDTSYGSGFLIASRNFIMTNNHVFPDTATAAASVAEFDYDEDDTLYSVSLDPDRFFMTDIDLDFSIVACDPSPLPDDVKAIPLLRDPDTITRGERVNIVQHPRGRRKEISLHDNKVNYVYDVGIRYTADTEGGSSGSPVFNNQWNLVALHHAGWADADGSATNEGIRIKAIVDHITAQNENESSDILESLVAEICSADDIIATSADAGVSFRHPLSRTLGNQTSKGRSLTINIDSGIDEITIKIG
ncbi:MAG: lysophospholipase L1-like esterase [Arenicella sp.]|jgi:lysophospholipase L1-like esterase